MSEVTPYLAEEKAPGVSRLIQRSFLEEQAKANLLDCLNAALEKYSEHSWLPREPGASFNPLPARLIEILLREARITDPEELFEVIRYVGKEFEPSTRPAGLAYGLDIARHLKNSSYSDRERKALHLKLVRLSESISSSESDTRLVILYRAALERLKKPSSRK